MIKCTANYCKSNSNFVIAGINKNDMTVPYGQAIKIVKNIINRGSCSGVSNFLQAHYNYVSELDTFSSLVSSEKVNWNSVIKGAEDSFDNPALDFYYNVIEEYLGEYAFVRQLIIPEVPINEIIDKSKEEFENCCYDFYIPQVNIVIEIDGKQHEKLKMQDKAREDCFKGQTIRINTYDIRTRSTQLKSIMEGLYNKLAISENINAYKNNLDGMGISKSKIELIQISRLEMCLLEMLKAGMLNFVDEWHIGVIGAEKRILELAIEDLLHWFNMIFKLQKQNVKLPNYKVNDENEKNILIDIDIYKRYDQTLLKENYEKVYIRNDYFETYQKNYYTVEYDELYTYNLDAQNEEDKKNLSNILNNIFKYDKFRNGQIEIIMNILNGNNTIGILPTGTGKSLCYQIATLLQPGISIIVCPLKSLLKDQMDSMQNKFITNNIKIDSSMNGEKKSYVLKNISKLKYQMIWVAPERLQSDEFRIILQELSFINAVKYAVIDEVHCMSEWGHNFRTSYLQLIKTFRSYLPKVVMVGLTATASDRVIKDIKIEFGINDEKNIITTLDFIRKELEFEVYNCDEKEKKKILEGLLANLQSSRNVLQKCGEDTNSGIVFSPFATGYRGCQHLSYETRKMYPNFENEIKYYIGSNKMDDTLKINVQNEFKNNEATLLFATKAFGMGIDKPNIRYIIHFGIPNSIEALYQEVGRAGRDGKKAICYIIHSRADYKDRYEKEVLFNADSSPWEIEKLLGVKTKKGSWGRGDVFDQLMLFYKNDYIDEENQIYDIYKNYIEGNNEFKIAENDSDEKEKYIYKLALLGIVKDWTISYNPKVIQGRCENLSVEQIKRNVESYIGKYEYGFSFNNLNPMRYSTIINIMQSEKNSVYKYIKIICTWYRENILYSRRKAIEQIDEFISSLESGKRCTNEFNNKIYNYFSPTDYNIILKYIFGELANYMSVLNLLLDENNKAVEREKLVAMKEALNRALVTNRPNLITNLFQIFIKMLLGEYEITENDGSLEECIKDILISRNRKDIYIKILQISKNLNDEYKNTISMLLMRNFNSRSELTLNYNYLKNEKVLEEIIRINLEKIEKLERDVVYGSGKNEY